MVVIFIIIIAILIDYPRIQSIRTFVCLPTYIRWVLVGIPDWGLFRNFAPKTCL